MARLSNVFRPEELRYVIIERRQLLVNLGENNLVILMDLSGKGLCIDSPQIRGLELEEFSRKFHLLEEHELHQCLKIDSETFMSVLNQCVSCLGCRRRVERLYKQLTESGHPVLDPLIVVQNTAHLTIAEERMKTPQSLGTLLYRHHEILNNLLENKLRNKTRCFQHSMEMFRSKPFSEIWRDAWSSMNRMCRDEFAVIETQELYAVLQNYLKRHKFCSGCRTKIDKAYKILVGESRTKEKGYVAALYANIKKCYPDKHVHLVTNKIEFFDALIRRAEPEIIGSMTKVRERHAKTMEVAQEEVLTCIGMILYERLRQAYICMREEERACQLLAAVGIHALYRSFDHYVEKKQGMSNLELLYKEMSRAEKAKELKRELRKLKKKQKKNEKKIMQIRLNSSDLKENIDEYEEDEIDEGAVFEVEAEADDNAADADAEEDQFEQFEERNVKMKNQKITEMQNKIGEEDIEIIETSDEKAATTETEVENCVLQEVLSRISPHQKEALEAPMTVVRHKKKKLRNVSKQQQRTQTRQNKTLSMSSSSSTLSRRINQQKSLPSKKEHLVKNTTTTKYEQSQHLLSKLAMKQQSTINHQGNSKSKTSTKNIVVFPTSTATLSQSAKCNDCQSLSLLNCRCENDVKDSGYGSEPSLSQTNSLNSSSLCSPEGSEISCTEGYCNHRQQQKQPKDQQLGQQLPNQYSSMLIPTISRGTSNMDIMVDEEDADTDQASEGIVDTIDDEENNGYDETNSEMIITMATKSDNTNEENCFIEMTKYLVESEQENETENNENHRLFNRNIDNNIVSGKYALEDANYISLEQMLLDVDEIHDNTCIPPEIVQQYFLQREEVQERRHLLRKALKENFLKMCLQKKQSFATIRSNKVQL